MTAGITAIDRRKLRKLEEMSGMLRFCKGLQGRTPEVSKEKWDQEAAEWESTGGGAKSLASVLQESEVLRTPSSSRARAGVFLTTAIFQKPGAHPRSALSSVRKHCEASHGLRSSGPRAQAEFPPVSSLWSGCISSKQDSETNGGKQKKKKKQQTFYSCFRC